MLNVIPSKQLSSKDDQYTKLTHPARLPIAMIQLNSVTKLYGTVIGVNDMTLDLLAGRVRAAGSQWVGEDNSLESLDRSVGSDNWKRASVWSITAEQC